MQAGFCLRRHWTVGSGSPEGDPILAVTQRILALAKARIAERPQRGIVKPLRPANITNANRYMINHGFISASEDQPHFGDPGGARFTEITSDILKSPNWHGTLPIAGGSQMGPQLPEGLDGQRAL